jgi:hypothetical protein
VDQLLSIPGQELWQQQKTLEQTGVVMAVLTLRGVMMAAATTIVVN